MCDIKNINTRNEKISKPQPFYAPGYASINQEEIRKRQIIRQRAEALNASITKCIDEEKENPYRVQALVYICKGLEIPEVLFDKIRSFDIKYGIKGNVGEKNG